MFHKSLCKHHSAICADRGAGPSLKAGWPRRSVSRPLLVMPRPSRRWLAADGTKAIRLETRLRRETRSAVAAAPRLRRSAVAAAPRLRTAQVALGRPRSHSGSASALAVINASASLARRRLQLRLSTEARPTACRGPLAGSKIN